MLPSGPGGFTFFPCAGLLPNCMEETAPPGRALAVPQLLVGSIRATPGILTYGGEGGIRTLGRAFRPYTRFPVVPLQPLGHLSFHGSPCRGVTLIIAQRRGLDQQQGRLRYPGADARGCYCESPKAFIFLCRLLLSIWSTSAVLDMFQWFSCSFFRMKSRSKASRASFSVRMEK